MPLNDIQIRKLRPTDKTQKKSDGEGLFIEVKPSGSKLWRMAYRFEGRQKLLSFGSYPVVSLATARQKRLEAKALLAQGIDPSAQKQEAKAEHKAQTENTFANIARELIDKKRREGKRETTLKKQRWYLSLAEPDIGERAVAEIKSAEVLTVLRKVESKGNYESARKLRGFIGEVFRYAIATTRAEYDPTYALQGALTAVSVKHMAAVTNWDDFGKLLKAIWAYDGGAPSTRAALKLMALLYPRPGELRLARWSEFDLNNAVWEIPEERSKMRRPHKKPLSDMAVKILKELHYWSGDSELAFKSDISRGKAISENTLNQALRRMGYSQDEMTSHGFRATASTLLNESGKWNADAIEAELAHVGADQIRRAYHRANYWDERVTMADWWAEEIGKCTRGC
ncbi:MAG: integrase [Ponticaulis sp.]|nr:integrase [Ponticaulis sp.]